MEPPALSDLFRKEAPGLTPLAVAVFMVIAGKGRVSPAALGRELEVPQASILRALAALDNDQGLVFVEEKGPLKKSIRLTEKGRLLAEKIKRIAERQNRV